MKRFLLAIILLIIPVIGLCEPISKVRIPREGLELAVFPWQQRGHSSQVLDYFGTAGTFYGEAGVLDGVADTLTVSRNGATELSFKGDSFTNIIPTNFNNWDVNTGMNISSGFSDPDGGNNAYKIENVSDDQVYHLFNSTEIPEGTYIHYELWLKGSGTVLLNVQENGDDYTLYQSEVVILTTSWVKYVVIAENEADAVSNTRVEIFGIDQSDEVYAYNPSVRKISHLWETDGDNFVIGKSGSQYSGDNDFEYAVAYDSDKTDSEVDSALQFPLTPGYGFETWAWNPEIQTAVNLQRYSEGAELLTNGDFTDWTGDDPDGWDVEGEDGINNYVSESSGKVRIVSDGTLVQILQSSLESGKKYYYEIEITDVTSGGININNTPDTYNTTGIKKGFFKSSITSFILKRGSACDITFDNVSVKEVPANALGENSGVVNSSVQAVSPVWNLAQAGGRGIALNYESVGYIEYGTDVCNFESGSFTIYYAFDFQNVSMRDSVRNGDYALDGYFLVPWRSSGKGQFVISYDGGVNNLDAPNLMNASDSKTVLAFQADWGSRKMRIYKNGVLHSEGDYTTKIVPPTSSKLEIGNMSFEETTVPTPVYDLLGYEAVHTPTRIKSITNTLQSAINKEDN